MLFRTSQQSVYTLVRSGILNNQAAVTKAQLQVATGRRILTASDDAAGTSILMGFERQIGSVDRYLDVLGQVRPSLDTATSKLEEAVGIMSSARELLIQSMNGTLNQDDRETLAIEIELMRDQMLAVANTKFNSNYLFAGTDGEQKPFDSALVGGIQRVSYGGNQETTKVLAGLDFEFTTNIPGSDVFASHQPAGTKFAGLTGLASGTSGDGGTGYEYAEIRNVGVSGTLGAGLAFASSGHTILQDSGLVVDSASNTVQLGNGEAIPIPAPGDPDFANFTVLNEHGAELHLDFTGYAGGDFTGTVTGAASISLDGVNFQPVTFTETDLELTNPASGAILHVDTTGLQKAGSELVTFSGSVNVFDVLQGVVDDLRNPDGIPTAGVVARLEDRLTELDRVQSDILSSLGTMGSRSARLLDTVENHQDLRLTLAGLASNIGDVDITDAVLDMQRADQALQLAQSTGARLIQNTLLNFL